MLKMTIQSENPTLSKADENPAGRLITIGIASWVIPGGGYFLLGERKRAGVVFAAVTATFLIGLWVGSVGVVDPHRSLLWFLAQVLASPAVFLFESITSSGKYIVYGRPDEMGKIYTAIAGLLNLLVIINSIYIGYVRFILGGHKNAK